MSKTHEAIQVIDKPWGFEEIIFRSGLPTVKILNVDAGQAISEQYHEEKSEFMMLIDGEAMLQLGNDRQKITPGKVCCIPPRCIHRLVAMTPCKVLEFSIGRDDDIIRLSDKYGRGDNRNA